MKEYFGFLIEERKRERVRKNRQTRERQFSYERKGKENREIVEYKEKRLQALGR